MFRRILRTPSSEVYAIFTSESEEDVGRVDLHYSNNDQVHGLLVLESERSKEEVKALLQTIDEDIVISADMESGNFDVTVVIVLRVEGFGKGEKGE